MRAVTLIFSMLFLLVGCSEMLPESPGAGKASVNISIKRPVNQIQEDRLQAAFIDDRTMQLDIFIYPFPFGSYDDIVKLQRCIVAAWSMSSEGEPTYGEIITPEIRSTCNVPGDFDSAGQMAMSMSAVREVSIPYGSGTVNTQISELEPGSYMIAVIQSGAYGEEMSKVRTYATLEPGPNNIVINLLHGKWVFVNESDDPAPLELQLLHKTEFFVEDSEPVGLVESPAAALGFSGSGTVQLEAVYLHETLDIPEHIYLDAYLGYHGSNLFGQYDNASARYYGLMDNHAMSFIAAEQVDAVASTEPAFIMQQYFAGASSHKITLGELMGWSGIDNAFGLIFYGADGTGFLNSLAKTTKNLIYNTDFEQIDIQHYWYREDLSEPGFPVIELDVMVSEHSISPFADTSEVVQKLMGLDSGERITGTLVEYFSTEREGGTVGPVSPPVIDYDPKDGFSVASASSSVVPALLNRATLTRMLQQQLALEQAEKDLGIGTITAASNQPGPKCFTSDTSRAYTWLLYRYNGTSWVPGYEESGEFIASNDNLDFEAEEFPVIQAEICLHPIRLAAQQPAPEEGPSNLIAHYTFDGNVADVKGAYDGASSVAGVTFDAGRFGQAVYLDGGYITLPHEYNPIISPDAEEFSISTWIKVDELPEADDEWVIFNHGWGEFKLALNHTGSVSFAVNEDQGYGAWRTIEGPVPLGEFVHIAAIYSRDNGMQLWVNGAGVSFYNSLINGMRDPDGIYRFIGFGRSSDEDGPFFQGAIDETRIFDRALTEAEVFLLADAITGTAGNDNLIGTSNNDIFIGSAGDDIIDGVGGVNTVVYVGNHTLYQVIDNGGGSYTVVKPDGTDTLTNIQYLSFGDVQNIAITDLLSENIVVIDCGMDDCSWIPAGRFAFPDDGEFSLNDPYVRLVPAQLQCEPPNPLCWDNIVCSVDGSTGEFGSGNSTCYIFSSDPGALQNAVNLSEDFQLILFDNDDRDVPNHDLEDAVYLIMSDFLPGETIEGAVVVEYEENRHFISAAEAFLFNFFSSELDVQTYLWIEAAPGFRYTETWNPSEVFFGHGGTESLPLFSGTLDTATSLMGDPFEDIHSSHWVYFRSGSLVFGENPNVYDVNIHWFSNIPMFAPLNDTGISTCVTDDDLIFGTSDCTVGPEIPLQDAYHGTNSFAFEKIDASGAVLSEAGPDDWDCVRDNTTGLLWQADGNQSGIWDNFPLPDSGFCGCEKWRVPAREELRSLIDYQMLLDDEAPAISDVFFPDSIMSFYWSSTGDDTHAWAVSFETGMEELKVRNIAEAWGYRAVCAPY